jgi:hypothetical protein
MPPSVGHPITHPSSSGTTLISVATSLPRPSKGARLYKRKPRYRAGRLVAQAVWIIRDGNEDFATGCVAGPSETRPPREAEQVLADYIARKYQPARRHRDIEEIDCADVLSVYLSDVGEPGDQFEIAARIGRLNEFWGSKMLSEVNAHTCLAYAKHRGNKGGARQDLETLRAAINHHAKEGFHRGTVRISLPPKGEQRDRWLTRDEAAALICIAGATGRSRPFMLVAQRVVNFIPSEDHCDMLRDFF